jgi:hypothetical protein
MSKVFALTSEQVKQLSTWFKKVNSEAKQIQRSQYQREDAMHEYNILTNGGEDIYTGAIGGRFTYSFTPTSLGVVVKVRDAITGLEEDLTNYDHW